MNNFYFILKTGWARRVEVVLHVCNWFGNKQKRKSCVGFEKWEWAFVTRSACHSWDGMLLLTRLKPEHLLKQQRTISIRYLVVWHKVQFFDTNLSVLLWCTVRKSFTVFVLVQMCLHQPGHGSLDILYILSEYKMIMLSFVKTLSLKMFYENNPVPITAHPAVFYSSRTTAIGQRLQFFIY